MARRWDSGGYQEPSLLCSRYAALAHPDNEVVRATRINPGGRVARSGW